MQETDAPAGPAGIVPEWHRMEAPAVMAAQGASDAGLTDVEAARRLERWGHNELAEVETESPWQLLAAQFTNVLVIILIVSALISFATGHAVDGTAILVIVLLAACLGFAQEYKAEKAMAALRELTAPTTRVVREGHERTMPSRDLVPGDLVPLSAGDVVAADARLVEARDLQVDESVLTGESVPVEKHVQALDGQAVPVADRRNMVHAGTAVAYGRARAVVVATGMSSEFGKIAGMLQTQQSKRTPLQLDLDRLGRFLGVASLILAALVALLAIARHGKPLEMFVWGVSLAVAVIPEALPAVVTISLALGVKRMVARRALIRKLPAVETLGATRVICSDKTGTLTTGEMTVRRIVLPDAELEVTGAGFAAGGEILAHGRPLDEAGRAACRQALLAAALCNDAQLRELPEGGIDLQGDPTEAALLVAAHKGGLPVPSLKVDYPRVHEITFSSERKRMSTVHRTDEGALVFSKGAPEVLLASCTHVSRGGETVPLDDGERERILARAAELGQAALRAIGVAAKPLAVEPEHATVTDCESGMAWLGLLGLMDPPRPEVKDAVQRCREAGIRTLMVTGDHVVTARAVARELGILADDGEAVISGAEVDSLGDEEFARRMDSVAVLARVSPAHKLRIVEAFRAKGQVVAMTGDGVNDAPALRRADIGIAMGLSGTGVSREASDMLLTDDNFSSIVGAVEEGRRIFDNIRKYLVFLLGGNMGAILAMIVALFADLPLPLVAVQVLFINMILDGLPAIALSVEPSEHGLMRRPPRDTKKPILDGEATGLIAGVALVVAAITLTVFIVTYRTSGENAALARTMFFATLVCCRLFNGYNCRSFTESTFTLSPLSNAWLVWGVTSALALTVLAIQVPFFGRIFHVVPLSASQWLVVVAASSLTLLGIEAAKLARRLLRR